MLRAPERHLLWNQFAQHEMNKGDSKKSESECRAMDQGHVLQSRGGEERVDPTCNGYLSHPPDTHAGHRDSQLGSADHAIQIIDQLQSGLGAAVLLRSEL